MAVILFSIGFFWQRLSVLFPSAINHTATSVAKDFRWWLMVVVLVFLYFGSQPLMKSGERIPVPAGAAMLLADEPTYTGRPIGFAWEGVVLATQKSRDGLLQIFGFDVWCKNFGPTYPILKDAYLISEINGSKLPMQVGDNANGLIIPADAAPIPVGAQFMFHATFKSKDITIDGGIAETDFYRNWGKFRVVVQYDDLIVSRDFDRAWVANALAGADPSLAPHISKRQ
jgi:hypothetical protein